jgi:hypothetical protein
MDRAVPAQLPSSAASRTRGQPTSSPSDRPSLSSGPLPTPRRSTPPSERRAPADPAQHAPAVLLTAARPLHPCRHSTAHPADRRTLRTEEHPVDRRTLWTGARVRIAPYRPDRAAARARPNRRARGRAARFGLPLHADRRADARSRPRCPALRCCGDGRDRGVRRRGRRGGELRFCATPQ